MTPLHTRRTVALGALLLAAPATAAAQIWPFRRQQNDEAQDGGGHEHHQHHGEVPDRALSAEDAAAVRALSACQSVGETCLSHCIAVLATGDASMAACARAVREMLAVCRASETLILTRSAFAGQQLALCREACAACRAECLPHAEHHATCGACAEACAAVIVAIDALLG